MKNESLTQQLRDALDQFEALMEWPLEPDSVDEWTSQVHEAFDRLRDRFRAHREHVHDKLLTVIEVNDDGSEHQAISDFKAMDKEIDGYFDVMNAHIASLAASEPFELDDRIEDRDLPEDQENQCHELVAAGTTLVGIVRKQEELITSWFAEAYVDEVHAPNTD